ncbi:hypothetical protein BKA57DRAFT_538665 [Linnemannia elongata]|nr:hypothetical protein BKA57DRAFT_538665 [Linnemannia elongata]
MRARTSRMCCHLSGSKPSFSGLPHTAIARILRSKDYRSLRSRLDGHKEYRASISHDDLFNWSPRVRFTNLNPPCDRYHHHHHNATHKIHQCYEGNRSGTPPVTHNDQYTSLKTQKTPRHPPSCPGICRTNRDNLSVRSASTPQHQSTTSFVKPRQHSKNFHFPGQLISFQRSHSHPAPWARMPFLNNFQQQPQTAYAPVSELVDHVQNYNNVLVGRQYCILLLLSPLPLLTSIRGN